MTKKTEWPDTAPIEKGNPQEIEIFLKGEIIKSQVTLIGELDLASPTPYAGVGWSLFELADYLVNKNIIKNSLTPEKMDDWRYSATLAIWSVGKAQIASDGAAKFWDLEGYSAGQLANIATMFFRSIEILELATFEGELLGAQKNVQLARIHAMIPDFVAQRYAEIIQRAVKFNQAKNQILHYVIGDSVISKGVSRLFSGRPEIGLDLIERSYNFLAHGYELDLPERLKSKLDRSSIKTRPKLKIDGFPMVEFLEWERAFRIIGATTWKILTHNKSVIEHDEIPDSNLYVTKDDIELIPILDTSNGYLICNSNGQLIYGNSIPSEGYLIWKNGTKILTSIEFLEDGYIPLWPDWNFSYFQNLGEIELQLEDGSTKKLVNRKTVEVIESKVSYLIDGDGNSVFSDYPKLDEPQYLKLTNHLTGSQIELNHVIGPVLDEHGGPIDVTISSGLGKSKRWTGLVVPGIEIHGLNNAVKVGENKAIQMKLSNNWKFTFPKEFSDKSEVSLNITVTPDLKPQMLKICNPKLEEFFLGVTIPVLSWSVEFSDRESATVASALLVNFSDRSKVQAIILHEVGDYIPLLRVGEVSIPGRKRGNDVRYDLRLLSDIQNETQVSVSMTWNYEKLDLMVFQKQESKRMKRVDPSDLIAAVIESKKFFSQDEWDSYKVATAKESQDLRAMLRRQRGNR